MSDLPELIAEHPAHAYASGVIRVGDPLPTVTEEAPDPFAHTPGRERIGVYKTKRPLRAGDRVKLAAKCGTCDGKGHHEWEDPCLECDGEGTVPFATATVTKVESMLDWETDGADNHYIVTVTDVQPIHNKVDEDPEPSDRVKPMTTPDDITTTFLLESLADPEVSWETWEAYCHDAGVDPIEFIEAHATYHLRINLPVLVRKVAVVSGALATGVWVGGKIMAHRMQSDPSFMIKTVGKSAIGRALRA